MAKQKSPVVKLQGTIDGLTFYRTQDGYLAREKGGVDPERLRSDPAFNNTRKAMAEFASAGQSASTFRKAWVNELSIASDGRITGRSVKAFMQVLKSDSINRRGLRKAALGDLTLLNGFEFNIAAPLITCLKADPTIAFNRATGVGAVNIPALVPTKLIAVPEMATHYKLFVAAATIDLGTGDVFTARAASAELPWNDIETAALSLPLALPAASAAPVFIALGIEYTGQVNGFSDPVSKNANAFKLILVDNP
jgi:hypothetical protein